MNEEKFMDMIDELSKYLSKPKVFIQDPARMADVMHAMETAKYLFPEAKITIEDDPIQMGALILCIEDFDLAVREIESFSDMISKADNFEIFHIGEENVKLAILFNGVLNRIKN